MAERKGDKILVSEDQMQQIVADHDLTRPQMIAVVNEVTGTPALLNLPSARKSRFSLTYQGQEAAENEARGARLGAFLAFFPAAACGVLLLIDRITTPGGSSDQATAAFGTAGTVALATSYYFNRVSNGLKNTAQAIGNYISLYGEQPPTQA